MDIDNIKVYGLPESIAASGLPMTENYDSELFENDVDDIQNVIDERYYLVDADGRQLNHMKRAERLSSFAPGEGHHCYLAGIIVQMNVTAPRYWWPEFQRYHFADIVSSTSTMHKLQAFCKKYIDAETANNYEEVKRLCESHFTKNTWVSMIQQFVEYSKIWFNTQDATLDMLKSNLPEGYLQTARITLNYRQLKTIYAQRKNHRLEEWQTFCRFIEVLPQKQLIIGGNAVAK